MNDPNSMDTSENKPAPESVAAPTSAALPSPSPAGTTSVTATPATTTIKTALATTMSTPTPTTVTPTIVAPQPEPIIRDSLRGVWILDKSRGEWSMRGYLETLNVPELAIQANEKGENELDTLQTIELTDEKVKITKRSRVNSNLVVELTYGTELIEYLKPDDRPKKQLATTEDSGNHLKIVSSLLTVNGMAHVTDIKQLVHEEGKGSVLIQKLTITNPESTKTHTTTRYFNPRNEPGEDEKIGELGTVTTAAEATDATNGDTKMETEE